jgi:hypothetical protein
VIFDRQSYACPFGSLDRLFENAREAFDLRSMWLVAKHQTAADDPHHFGTHRLACRQMTFQIGCRFRSLSASEPVRMSPSHHAVQVVFVELVFEPRQIVGIHAGQEASFQGDPVCAESDRFVDRLLELPSGTRIDLIWINLTE